jgi:aminopeptidase N
VFSEFPFEELRIVEFPRVAGFAMGHPTLIPFSEALGFLTVGDDGISNINFMVTAHEVAHQWWGNITTPAPVPGASFLTEALAHYSTLLMEERFNGRVAARNRRLEFEKLYLESRKADVERPVVRIDGSESSDQSLWYNKGGLVFWMTSETIGREAFLSALRAFIGEFSFQHDHPTIFDLIRHIREEAGPEHEAFLRQWFFEVVLPRPEVVSAESRAKDGGYETLVVVRNAGTGTIDLEVELANRRRVSTEIGIQPRPTRLRRDDLPEAEGWVEEERTDDEGDAEKVSRAAGASREPYRAVRTGIRLAAGEEKSVTLFTEFEVKHVLLDPDAELLVAGRHGAQKGL